MNANQQRLQICQHGIYGYCDDCVTEAEHTRCFERFERSGKNDYPQEGVGYQP